MHESKNLYLLAFTWTFWTLSNPKFCIYINHFMIKFIWFLVLWLFGEKPTSLSSFTSHLFICSVIHGVSHGVQTLPLQPPSHLFPPFSTFLNPLCRSFTFLYISQPSHHLFLHSSFSSLSLSLSLSHSVVALGSRSLLLASLEGKSVFRLSRHQRKGLRSNGHLWTRQELLSFY